MTIYHTYIDNNVGLGSSTIAGIQTNGSTYGVGISSNGYFSGVVTATTFYGDGSQLTGISTSGGIAISTNTTNQNQYINYATSFGSITGLGATTLLVYNPSSGNLGIGTTNPSSILDAFGDLTLGDNTTTSGSITRRNTNSRLSLRGGENIGISSAGAANIELYGIDHPELGRAYYDALTHSFRDLNEPPRVYANISTSTSQFNNVVRIGAATSTGTASQPLQVTGGAYVSGNLGIGITNPSVKLDCGVFAASTATAIFARGADGNFQLTAQNGTSTNASGSAVARFGVNYSGTGWNSYLQFIRGGGPIDGSLAIFTNNTEKVRFDSVGNVGVGISLVDTYNHGGTNIVTQIYNSGTSLNSQAHILIGSGAASQTLSSVGSISWGLPTASAANHGLAYISCVTGSTSTSANPTGRLVFGTRSSSDSTFIDRMSLSETGTLSANSIRVSTSFAGNFGSIAASWSGNTIYPTLYSDSVDRWIMHINPHISYVENGTHGYTGTMTGATIRMASTPSAATYWDMGIGTNSVGTDKFSIGRTGSNLFSITNTGEISSTNNITLGTAASGSVETPYNINLGNTYSNGTTRDKLKIYLYSDGGTERYGFSVGGTGDIQYHSNVFHDFYISNTRIVRINSTQLSVSGSLNVTGSVSKGSGSFVIDHPLNETKNLVHSFIEGPRADLIYRGTVSLIDGSVTINLDEEYELIPGTWKALCRNPQVWISNIDGWTNCRGTVEDGILIIEAQYASNESVNWLVIAERQDKHMYDTEWTDSNGRPILEPVKL